QREVDSFPTRRSSDLLVSPVGEGNGRGAGSVADQGDGRSPNVGTEQGRQDSCESESLHGGDYIPAVWKRSTSGALRRDPTEPERDRKSTRLNSSHVKI